MFLSFLSELFYEAAQTSPSAFHLLDSLFQENLSSTQHHQFIPALINNYLHSPGMSPFDNSVMTRLIVMMSKCDQPQKVEWLTHINSDVTLSKYPSFINRVVFLYPAAIPALLRLIITLDDSNSPSSKIDCYATKKQLLTDPPLTSWYPFILYDWAYLNAWLNAIASLTYADRLEALELMNTRIRGILLIQATIKSDDRMLFTLLEFIEEHIAQEDHLRLFEQRDPDQNATILHIAAQYSDGPTMEKLCTMLLSLKKSSVKPIIGASKTNQHTALMLVTSKTARPLLSLLTSFGRKQTRDWFLETDKQGYDALILAGCKTPGERKLILPILIEGIKLLSPLDQLTILNRYNMIFNGEPCIAKAIDLATKRMTLSTARGSLGLFTPVSEPFSSSNQGAVALVSPASTDQSPTP
jgi:hypothetical protein